MAHIPRDREAMTRRGVVWIYDHLSPAGRAGLKLLTETVSIDAAQSPVHTHPEKQAFDVRFRLPTEGPEYRMVDEFTRFGLPDPARGEQLSILIEPKVETSVPDLVAIYWDRSVADAWSTARRELSKVDIRLLHYVYSHGQPVAIDALTSRYRAQGVKRSIQRLLAADVVEERDGALRTGPLENIFSLRRLICIEAKVSAPARALEQAVRCSWFASHVYLLLPNVPSDPKILRGMALHGIGVALPDRPLDAAPVQATPGELPRSYASWLLNEWVWRLSDARSSLALEHPARS
jgi:hypothetical protein